jgi:hypothetical protein
MKVVKLPLGLIKYYGKNRFGEWRYNSTIFDLGTRWRGAVSFTHLPLYPRGNTHWIYDWVGPREPLDSVEYRTSCPCRESNPSSEASKPSLYRLSHPGSHKASAQKLNKDVHNHNIDTTLKNPTKWFQLHI